MEMTWCSAPHLETIYLEVAINAGLGVVMIQEKKDEPPKLIFCSLFEDPVNVFYQGLDRRDVGLTIGEARALLDAIEAKIATRPFPEG